MGIWPIAISGFEHQEHRDLNGFKQRSSLQDVNNGTLDVKFVLSCCRRCHLTWYKLPWPDSWHPKTTDSSSDVVEDGPAAAHPKMVLVHDEGMDSGCIACLHKATMWLFTSNISVMFHRESYLHNVGNPLRQMQSTSKGFWFSWMPSSFNFTEERLESARNTGMEPAWFDDVWYLLFPGLVSWPWPRHQQLWRSRWRQRCPPNRIPCMALAAWVAVMRFCRILVSRISESWPKQKPLKDWVH